MAIADGEMDQKYNDKIVKTGDWINVEFLKEVIDNTTEDEVDIVDFNVQAAVGEGENYLSILYKTTVTYNCATSDEPQTKHLMIKGMTDNEFFKVIINESDLFTKEISTYNECFPIMRRAFRRYFPKGTPQVVPDFYECSRPNTLVMEDLGVEGYKMANRHDQLDFEHTEVALRTVARYHALTCKLQSQRPDLVSKAAMEFYSTGGESLIFSLIETIIPSIESLVETWDEVSRYAPVIRNIHKCFYEKLLELLKPTKGFNVLNHGDLWSNNVLFKYDDGTVKNAKLVDFQLTRYTTPALDLYYMLLTSVQPDVLTENMFELVEIYHTALLEDCATLQMDVDYPIEQLYEDLRNTVTFGYLVLIQLGPVVVAQKPGKTENGNDSNEYSFKKSLKNPLFRRNFCKIITFLDSIGYLEEALNRMRYVEEAVERNQQLAVVKEDNGNRQEEEEGEKEESSEKYQPAENDTFSKFWRFISQPVCP